MTTYTSSMNIYSKSSQNHIYYPRLNTLNSEINRCQELSKKSSEPQCMSLEGEPGAGKTTLVRDYANQFPRYKERDGFVVPVFYSEIPSPATIKSTAASLLERLGDPGAQRGTLWSMTSRLIGLIIDCKVEIVILDEFSNLIDTETNHVLNQVSDWLKMLIKETGVPFMVVGISGKVDRILNANAQLSRLFAFRETLQPFSWENEDSIKEFSIFLQHVERIIGIELSHSLSRAEIYYRIYYSTNGFVGNIMNLLQYAGLLAVERNSKEIDLVDLSIAFCHRIEKYLFEKENPFLIPPDQKFLETDFGKYCTQNNSKIINTLTAN